MTLMILVAALYERRIQLPAVIDRRHNFRVFRGQLIPTTITSKSKSRKAQLDSGAFAV
jgi:hypothetical protein